MDPSNVINIVKYLIRSTPYGHLKETVENLKNLVGSHIIEEKEVQDEIASYEEEHLKHVNLNDDKIIISKFNKDEENYYHEQTKKIKILINPLSENIEKISDLEEDYQNSNFRDILDKALNEYKDKSYKSAITASNSILILNFSLF
jgi:hypothetical protein